MTFGVSEKNLYKLLLDKTIDIGKFAKINCLKILVCFHHAITIKIHSLKISNYLLKQHV